MFMLTPRFKSRSSQFMRHILLGCLFLGFIGLIGCDKTPPRQKPLVVSTTGMIGDIVSNIGGEVIESVSLMGPGVDPHLYKASEGDVRTLSEANMIFYNGLHLEARMIDIFEKLAVKKPVIAVTRSIPESALRTPEAFDGMHDPHVWFDVTLWINAAQVVQAELMKFDPDNKTIYEENGTAYIEKLWALHRSIKEKISIIPESERYLVTAHDAFGYFGAAYAFKVVGLQGISTAAEAGAQDVQKLASYIVQHNIPAIFVESSIPERTVKAVQAAVKAKGKSVKIGGELFSDAMGSEGTPEGTYMGMVEHNIHTIIEALK